MALLWLWDALILVGRQLIYDLLFPKPVGDATLPRYICPPDALPPFEGGQCPVPYNITIRVVQYGSTGGVASIETYTSYNIQGPLLGFRTRKVSELGHHFGVDNNSGYHFLWGATLPKSDNNFMELSQYEAKYWYPNTSHPYERYVYDVVSIVRVDGLPDDCGSLLPPPKDRDRLIPVAPPVPVPAPLPPPIVVPRVPVPLPIPPALPLPPGLPRPPLPINPPPLIGNVNLNFNFYNDIDFNFNININNGTGTLPIEPFQALAKLIYAVWMDVKETREVIDRMAEQLECLHNKFCREGKEIHRRALGIVGYDRQSHHGFLVDKQHKLTPVVLQLIFNKISNTAGRRVRPHAPNLYSPQSLGYYAFQFESGGFGALEEIRFSNTCIPIPERTIAIVVWVEPQAGEGNLYCWYEKTMYAENQPPAVSP